MHHQWWIAFLRTRERGHRFAGGRRGQSPLVLDRVDLENGAGLGEGDRAIHPRFCRQSRCIGGLSSNRRSKGDQWIAGPSACQLLRIAVIVALAMGRHAIGMEHLEEGSVGASNALHHRGHVCHKRRTIGRVTLVGRNAERGGPGGDVAGNRSRGWRRLGVAVVLQDIENRHLPKRGQVECLVDDTFAGRAVAQEAHRDGARTREFLGEGHAGGDGHNAPLDAVRVEVAMAQVLAAATAATNTRFAPHDLGDQAVRIPGINQVVPVASVRREHDVALQIERANNGDGAELLADARVGGAIQPAFRKKSKQPFLDRADQRDLVKHPRCVCGLRRRRAHREGAGFSGHSTRTPFAASRSAKSRTDRIETISSSGISTL